MGDHLPRGGLAVYSLEFMLHTLTAVAAISAAVLASLYLILPRVARYAARPRYSRKG